MIVTLDTHEMMEAHFLSDIQWHFKLSLASQMCHVKRPRWTDIHLRVYILIDPQLFLAPKMRVLNVFITRLIKPVALPHS